MKFLSVLLLFFSSCSTKSLKVDNKHIIFIHGSHLDGSLWNAVRKITDKKFQSLAPSTGHRSLYDAARFYCEKIQDKAVIVGHSYGGAIANQMSAYCAKKVERIIYVAAVSPHNQEMSFDLLSLKDQKSYSGIVKFTEKFAEPKDKTTFLKVMTGTKNSELNVAVLSEPISVGGEKLELDQAALNRIPKNYIFTEKDSIIEIASQEKYAQRDQILVTRTIKTGHLPMITNSKELAEIIKEIVSSSK